MIGYSAVLVRKFGCHLGLALLLMSASFDRFGAYRTGALLFAAASAIVALLTFAMPAYAAPGSRRAQ